MRDYAGLYSKISERQNLLLQGYIDSQRTTFREQFAENNEFIDALPISGKQKEILHSIMEHHRVLVEGSLENLEDMSRLCTKAMRNVVSGLSPEEQKEIISTYGDNKLFVIQGGQQ